MQSRWLTNLGRRKVLQFDLLAANFMGFAIKNPYKKATNKILKWHWWILSRSEFFFFLEKWKMLWKIVGKSGDGCAHLQHRILIGQQNHHYSAIKAAHSHTMELNFRFSLQFADGVLQHENDLCRILAFVFVCVCHLSFIDLLLCTHRAL